MSPKLHPILGARLVGNKVCTVLVCNLLTTLPHQGWHLICYMELLLSSKSILHQSWNPRGSY